MTVDRVDCPRFLARCGLDGVPHCPPGARRGDDVAGARALLKPGGLVDGSACDERVAGHDLAGREADAGDEARGAERIRRRDRTQRIVVPGRRDAEYPEHPSAAERGDTRPVARELLLGGAGPLEQRGALCLGVVECLGRADVGDQDGDELARLDGRRRDGRGATAAGGASAEPVRAPPRRGRAIGPAAASAVAAP